MATKNIVCGQCGKDRHFIRAKRCDECGAILPDQPGYVAPAAQPQPAPAPAPATAEAQPAAPQPAPQAQPAAHVCPSCGGQQTQYGPDTWLCQRCDSAVINDIGATPTPAQPAPAPRPAANANGTRRPQGQQRRPDPTANANGNRQQQGRANTDQQEEEQPQRPHQPDWLQRNWKWLLFIIGGVLFACIAVMLIGSMLFGRVAPYINQGTGGPTPAPTAVQQPTAQPTAPVIAGQPTAAPTMAPTAAPTAAAPQQSGPSIIADGVNYKQFVLDTNNNGSQATGSGAFWFNLPSGWSTNAHHVYLVATDGSSTLIPGKDNQVVVIINESGKDIKILAPVGAGIDHTVDRNAMVNARLLPGGGCSDNGCLSVNYVVIKADGTLDTGIKTR